MATQLFFRASFSDYWTANNDANLRGTAVGWDPRQLSLTRGASTTSVSVSTVTGATPGVEVGTTPLVWYSPPLDADITISGSVTWNLWSSESNMSANVAINGQLEVIDGATGTITLIDQTARVTEVAVTTRAVNNFAETPAAGVACKRGDRLRVRVFGDDVGAMATGFTFDFSYDSPSASVDGDSYLTLTENLTFVSEPAGTTIYPTDTAGPSVTPTAPSLLTAFTGSDEDPLSDGGNWARLNTNANSTQLKRVSNQVTIVSGGLTFGGSYWTPTNFGPDLAAYTTLATAEATQYVAARVQGAGGSSTWDGYVVAGGATVNLVRIDNASQTTVATSAATVASGDALGIACRGSTIEAWYKPAAGSWTLACSVTDTTHPAAGRVALVSSGTATTGRFDDFYVGAEPDWFRGSGVEREAWTSRGAGVQTDVTNTAAGWTAPIQVTDTAGGTVVDWFTKQLTAFTLGGAVRVNVRAAMSIAANTGMRCEIARVASDGTSATVWGSMAPFLPLTASEAAQSLLVAGDDLAVSDGQRLRIRFYLDDANAAMVTGRTCTLYYAGTSGGASGDTYLTFTQTLTEFVAAGTVPRGRPQMSQIIVQ